MRRPLLAAAVVALACAAASSAAPRMYVGFMDDRSFRWDGDRHAMLDRARASGATVVRSIVDWRVVAPVRPADAADPFDPAYRFTDVDDLVRDAQQRGIEVLLTIWGTPAWANGGRTPNYPPDDATDLGAFASAVASRYSGRHAAYPFVRFYSVWNEPNREQFLAPQYDDDGASVAPAAYARMYAAAHAALKRASPTALVGIGETAARGHDRPTDAVQPSHSPVRFAMLVAAANPSLRFDAWAHHPYPPRLDAAPLAHAPWPSVGLGGLDRFGAELERAFDRRGVRIWVSEYAHQTSPQEPAGVPYGVQGQYLEEALAAARRSHRVRMFVWFVFRDHVGDTWQSGVVDAASEAKPALAEFAAAARRLDVRNSRVVLSPQRSRHRLRVAALEMRWHLPPGGRVGIAYRLSSCGRTIATGMPASPIGRDGWVAFDLRLAPQPGRRYRLDLELNDIHGFRLRRELELVGGEPATPVRRSRAACARR